MTFSPQMQITNAGMAAAISASGLAAEITHIVLGDANGTGYAPDGTETALRNEIERLPISEAYQVGDNTYSVSGMVEPSDGTSYNIREIGVVLSDGTLLAVWSDPLTIHSGRGPGASYEFTHILDLSALPIGSVTVTVTPGGDPLRYAIATNAVASMQNAVRQMRLRNELETMKEAAA